MTDFRLSHPDRRAWTPASDLPRKRQSSVADRSRIEVLSQADPYVQVTETDADTTIPLHSHSSDEVMIVMDGSLEVEGSHCPAGSVLVVPAGAEYSIHVGTAGATFAVVRAKHGEIAERPGTS